MNSRASGFRAPALRRLHPLANADFAVHRGTYLSWFRYHDGSWFVNAGGESGIRTHVRVSPKHAFQACAFSHSAISPAQVGTHSLYSLMEMHADGARSG